MTGREPMIGAIAGDIIGSAFEHDPIKTKDFELHQPRARFTDDSVLTVAVAQAILEDGDYGDAIREIGRWYPRSGYGLHFYHWMMSGQTEPYNSFGNGSAMRVSPVGFAFNDEKKVLTEARRSAEISHNHPEGIKGAQATALSILLARKGYGKKEVKQEIESKFGYDLRRSLAEIRPEYEFDVTCQGSVPEAIIAFLESTSYEDAVRNAVSLGGDSDTQACIAGGIAQAHYGMPPVEIVDLVREILPDDLWTITEVFCDRFGIEVPGPTP
jgi:ADP-ribosylglycohydrolase